MKILFGMLFLSLGLPVARAAEPFPPPTYKVPVRIAHVTGKLELGRDVVCPIDASVPVYEYEKEDDGGFSTPDYVDCQQTVNGQVLFSRTVLWIDVKPGFQGMAKWLHATTFVNFNDQNGKIYAILNGGVGSKNTKEQYLNFYTDTVRDKNIIGLTLYVDDNEMK